MHPARLLWRWDSPGKNIGVGCHSFLQGIFLTHGSIEPASFMSLALAGSFFITSTIFTRYWLSDMRFENTSFRSVACLFILLMEMFMEQKILTLMKSNLPFFFMVCDFGVNFRNLLPSLRSHTICPMLPWWLRQWSVCLQCRRPEFNPWVRKIPWRRKWQPTPVFLPGKSHGWQSLVGYLPQGCKESDTTERDLLQYFLEVL